jgi:transposase
MAKPYSKDLRERVIQAVKAGHSRRAVVQMFRVGERTVRRYLSLWEKTGSVVSQAKFGRHKKHVLAEHACKVQSLLANRSDMTLEEMRAALEAEGVEVGISSIDRYLKASGLRYKKNPSSRRAGPARGPGSPHPMG